MEFKHISVLLEPTVESLNIKPGGLYVDCTAGGGGHSAFALSKLDGGRMILIDRDPSAVENLHARFDSDPRVTVVRDNFANIRSVLDSLDLEGECANGIMADLGVSSHQLDCAERGFSYHKDAPLDMRMSREGASAADIVNTYSQREIQNILYKYADEKFAPAIAKSIVSYRAKKTIETTLELASIVSDAVPAAAKRSGHPARKTFQALRIEVNGELDRLGDAVESMFDALLPGGRLAIITFHSLEDRIVKNKFKSFCEGCICPPDFPVCVCGRKPRGKIPFKPITPSAREIEQNPRSRRSFYARERERA